MSREHKILSYTAQYTKVYETGPSSRVVVREAALGRRGWGGDAAQYEEEDNGVNGTAMSDDGFSSAEADRRDAERRENLLQAGAVMFLRRHRRRRRSFVLNLRLLLFRIGFLWQAARVGVR